MVDIKLIICDIDYTLVTKDKRVLDEYTKNVFEILHNKGILIGVASGRPLNDVKIAFESWGLSFKADVIIAMNGGQLWIEKDQSLYEFYKLKKEWIKEIAIKSLTFGANPYMYYGRSYKAMKEDEFLLASAKRNNYSLYLVKNVEEFSNEENAKIMVRIFDEEKMKAFKEFLDNNPSKDYAHFKTQTTLMEFCDSRVSKGNCLKEYADLVKIPLQNIMAFGDAENDNSMLEYSGIGICLLNGEEKTKKIADDITRYQVEEDGVARYLEEKIIKKFGW